LDNTWVHPENYGVARAIRETITTTGNLSSETLKSLKEAHQIGDTTISDIVDELKKPNRDPRDGYPKPVTRKGVVTFEDLHEGMMITGKIKNVVDFGAFVDLGIKETALIHISEMSDQFVKDPMDMVKVGDVLEFRILNLDRDRGRIGLSRKTQEAHVGSVSVGAPSEAVAPPAKKRVVVVKKPASLPAADASNGGAAVLIHAEARRPDSRPVARAPQRPAPPRPDDDGTMYNPFADALQKMKDKKKSR
jgi:uncharacterized protein